MWIAENEPLQREIIVAELQEAGFDVDETKSGEQVAAALDGGTRIDLVITDLRRSGTLDAWDVGAQARLRDAMMPIICAIGVFSRR